MNCDPNRLSLENAFSQGAEISGENLIINISGAIAVHGTVCSGNNIRFDNMTLTFENFRLVSAFILTRRVLDFKSNSPKEIKGRKLYKSEIEDFTQRFVTEEWDIMSFEFSDKKGECKAAGKIAISLVFSSNGDMFTVNISCDNLTAEAMGEGEIIPKAKISFLKKFSKIFKGKNSR
ncbi:MAG: hypothetical protein K2K57_08310 [Oscillospiraceae bacterium]|nr:hypothetical protein [Oscillospiraceae bacterium]